MCFLGLPHMVKKKGVSLVAVNITNDLFNCKIKAVQTHINLEDKIHTNHTILPIHTSARSSSGAETLH